MKKRSNGLLSLIRFVFFMVLIIVVLSVFYYNSSLNAPYVNGDVAEKEVEIPKGSKFDDIVDILKKEELIKDGISFKIYCKLNDQSNKIQAGKYYLKNSMDVKTIVEILTSGKAHIDTEKFTIPEGFELRQIIDRLVESGLVEREAFITALDKDLYDYDFLRQIPDREIMLEGYLFPDTYEIYRNATEQEIVDKMLNRFDMIFNEAMKNRAKELNMTIDQVLTLASIIEREAKADSERKTVAAVFHNRLKKGMMLQSCATVQYLLKERKDVLTYKDLEIKSPYNTYKYVGLPPGPIASPGLESIEAALYPDKVDYLYFVAREDGTHVFSRTYKEHLDAQNKIRK